jgi:flagellum-specific ATP synthase
MGALGLGALRAAAAAAPVRARSGRVVKVVGTLLEAEVPATVIGEVLTLADGTEAEAVGFREGRAILVPLGPLEGVRYGAAVRTRGEAPSVPVGGALRGRIVDALGNPIDGRGPLATRARRPLHAPAPPPLARPPIREFLSTGVRAIDGLLAFGRGQRVALVAGSGVGKSTLMGMIARRSAAHANVIALVGERGREVREFVEDVLGPEGLARSVVVVATADQPPVLQVRAAFVAAAISESLRDEGQDVMLFMDSLTRLAMAQRQVGLAAGEPPTTKGYTPSVFALLPRLLERAGRGEGTGSITALYTVLVDGDDVRADPIGDAVRGIVDGHIVLSRRIASLGLFPAVDILGSISRVMPQVTSPRHVQAAQAVRRLLATWSEHEELVRLGAYKPGSDAEVDRAIQRIAPIRSWLAQRVTEVSEPGGVVAALEALAA